MGEFHLNDLRVLGFQVGSFGPQQSHAAFDEKRIASCSLKNECYYLFAYARTGDSVSEGLSFMTVEAAKRDMVCGASELPDQMRVGRRSLQLKITVGPKDARSIELTDDECKHPERGRIGIVKVIEDKQQGLGSRDTLEYCRDRIE
jgi:hypothetical protein